MDVKCHCGSPVEYKDSSIIYGRSYGMVYICSKYPECDSFVGVHKGTKIPKGSLANKETREWRKAAHDLFDPIWKSRSISRGKLYMYLSDYLGISPENTHIGMFGPKMCEKVIEFCIKAIANRNKRLKRE